jgi:hypothetical protein
MKLTKKSILKIAFVSFMVFFVVCILCVISIHIVLSRAFGSPQKLKVRLLCETDYQELLNSCREFSRQVATGKLNKSFYHIPYKPDPEISHLPQSILKLDPQYISGHTDGTVTVNMIGGLTHFGVIAYPEDYKPPYSNYRYGDKELIPGLWYYDDEIDDKFPSYEKYIDSLIKKGKARQKEKSLDVGKK